jgi:hypothetical protein
MSRVGFKIMVLVLSSAASNRGATVTISSFPNTIVSNEHIFQVASDDSVGA